MGSKTYEKLHCYGKTNCSRLFNFQSEKEERFPLQTDMTLDSQACQKHINDLFDAVSIIYISALFLQVFNEEKFHSLIQSPMNQ